MSKSLKFSITSIAMVLIMVFSFLIINNQKADYIFTDVAIRNVSLQQTSIDYESILNEFENAELRTTGSLTTFEGYKSINIADLTEIDNLSEEELDEIQKTTVKYNFSYDSTTNIVTLSAESKDEDGEISIDTIEGIAFYNENGEIDALLDVDGDYILLSEMQDAELIQNCGWFKNLFKKVATKIVVAVVAVVAVAAVTAVVVATCGAGLGAVIAAGAIAGGVTGAVAGGVISYSEYGKLDWKWIVGGAVIGAALGAVTGWGVGSAMGVGSTAKTAGYLSKNFNFSNTVLNHTDRPYRASQLLAKEIMQSGSPIADSTISGGLKWTVAGSFNGTLGTWELVYDVAKNVVVHFLFKG